MQEEVTTADRPRDRYDQEIERLTMSCSDETEFNNRVQDAWSAVYNGGRAMARSPLFAYASVDRKARDNPEKKACGCVTQIRNSYVLGDGEIAYSAWTPELTEKIGTDELIPYQPDNITPKDLHHLADVQRVLDRELNREPLPLLPEPLTPYPN
jgi:hypothetical protein